MRGDTMRCYQGFGNKLEVGDGNHKLDGLISFRNKLSNQVRFHSQLAANEWYILSIDELLARSQHESIRDRLLVGTKQFQTVLVDRAEIQAFNFNFCWL